MALIASNFRSTCGPERGTPESSTQRFPAGAPQVGQRTEDHCLRVSSFFFIPTECDNAQLRNRSILNYFYLPLACRRGDISFHGAKLNLIVWDDAEEGRIYAEPAVVLDEAQFSELVHEKIHTRARCTDHFR